MFFHYLLCFSIVLTVSALPSGQRVAPPSSRRVGNGFDMPIHVRQAHGEIVRRGDVSGDIGLGNNADLLYSVPIELGNSVVAVNLDTGSSDLWLISDTCQTNACNGTTAGRYHPSSSLKNTGADVTMLYGDSTTGTFAKGTIGLDTATIAGIAMTDQSFGLINDTTNVVVQFATSGIFGLGFPSGSKIQENLIEAKNDAVQQTDDLILSTYSNGPLLSRIAMTGALKQPIFSITLSRDTIDIGGTGLLTIGKLPDGVDSSTLTWVPVRLYNVSDGGLPPPSFAPDETYPFRWEIDIDGVFLDGQQISDSAIPAVGVDSKRVSALIDTGNSILRGPQDVVTNIISTISPKFNPNRDSSPTVTCAVPHTLSFQIGGKMFPIDPRDFISQNPNDKTAKTCIADNLVSTDPPSVGALYRWSLGAPFFRSNLVVFHYGNLTHPSVDPPRIGIFSNVPSNAGDLLKQAVLDAQNNNGKFEETSQIAPTASAAAESQVTVSVGQPLTMTKSGGNVAATTTLSLPSQPLATGGGSQNGASSLLRVSWYFDAFCLGLSALLALFFI